MSGTDPTLYGAVQAPLRSVAHYEHRNRREGQKTAVAAPEAVQPVVKASADLAWTIVQMRPGERIVINEALVAAYQAASSPHSIRALKSDFEAFDAWCRRTNRIALPATAETVADYLDARAVKFAGDIRRQRARRMRGFRRWRWHWTR